MRSLILAITLAAPLAFLAPQARALEVGEEAPCVILNHIAADGSESEHCIREPNKEGQFKVLEFFSATCGACARNLPKVSAIAKRVENVATVRLVGIDRSESLLRDYVSMNRNLVQFEVALDTSRDAKRAYDVISTPTLFVLDANDVVRFKHEGVLSDADSAEIERLVTERR